MFQCFDVLTSLQACLAAVLTCLNLRNEDKRSCNQKNARIECETNVHRVLILGTPESGKSTLIKHMKIIYSHGFTKQELISFKVHAHAVLSCKCCVGEDMELLPFVAHSFCSLWGDLGIRAAVVRGHEFQLNDSALYFFENISRIITPNYIPTKTDVLRVRVRTHGVIETQFRVNNSLYRLYDVGGHCSERKKWYSYFDSVQAVLFMVALSGYDQNLDENHSKPSPKAFQRIWQYIKPALQLQTTCNHTSLGPPDLASSPPRSSETSRPESCCNNRFA
ncbi:guanine nucleotide-binding protein G(o) subunit alpha-like [Carassius gibelio]|uniref:guanine nucleotide-binding protein G(o) subunit alpha-like n=1 Tax=Carassius gibelio TaxID=101364 RepID=UPI0022777CD7|nr:guanine nucleotide-binding protein G(o) subunit alpha-like [Carassius gibelio]